MINLNEQIDESIEKKLKVSLKESEDKLLDKVSKAVIKSLKLAKPIQVVLDTVKLKATEGLSHEVTPQVLSYTASRLPVLMVGQAGSGKTHIAVACAEMLGLPHYSMSVNEQSSKADFLGYQDATGQIVKTNFRKAYEQGGVFIIDEIDAGNPNILTVINSALSNDFCSFPDGMIQRHKDFVCVCTANTFGEGESLQYIGRNILDSATRDRFATVVVGYSDLLEKALLPNYYTLVRELRAHFENNGVLSVVSTRGGLRLETLMAQKKEKLTYEEIVACLNMHQEIKKDQKVVSIIKEEAGKVLWA